MHVVMFYHSIVSDWNHGNAHFLRGIVSELMARGHRVEVYEPKNGWSYSNLLREKGEVATSKRRIPLSGRSPTTSMSCNWTRSSPGRISSSCTNGTNMSW